VTEVVGWIAAIVTTVATLFIAQKHIWCWPIRMGANTLWCIYAVTISAWPLMIMQFIYMATNIYGWMKWKSVNEAV